jgi:hypothetical protein
MTKALFWCFSLALSLPMLVWGQTKCKDGILIDAHTQKPIIGAHLLILESGQMTVSDSTGFFQLCFGQDSCRLSISHVAYLPYETKVHLAKAAELKISLVLNSIEVQDVFVEGNRQDANQMPGHETITQAQILSMPSLLGEHDVIRTLQQTAGVQSVSEGVAGIFVRGGGAGHNLVLLDNMELANPFHLMGIYSVFNPLTTGKAEIYKGNAPINLRGKIASTIRVSSISPLNTQNFVQASIGNISSNVAWAQKTANNKLSVVAGIRRSYLELFKTITSLFVSEEDNYFNRYFYSFYDFNGRINYQVSNNSSINLGWYWGNDDFSIDDGQVGYNADNNYGNKALALEYKSALGQSSYISALINYTQSWSGFDGDLLENRIRFGSELRQISAKLTITTQMGNHFFRYGADAYRYKTQPQDLFMVVMDDTLTQRDMFYNDDISFFAENTYSLTDKWNTYIGFRIYKYWNYEATDNETWNIGHEESISNYLPFVPSVAVSYIPNTKTSFNLAYIYNVQTGHLASISSIPLPNDIWAMSSTGLKPERAHQLSWAYWQKFPFGSFSTEVYGKVLENQLIFNVNTNRHVEMEFEDHFFVGKGKTYGAEFSFEKTTGRITGAMNYSLSRSKRSFSDIYNGQWFNDKFDRIHDLSLVSSYIVNSRLDLGFNWVYATGNCITLPAGRYWAMGTIMSDYEGYNTFRLPPYHRLDLSANIKLNSKHFKESVLNVSVINLYNRSNPYFIYYKIYQGTSRYDIQIKAAQVSLFPVMPSVSWRFKF